VKIDATPPSLTEQLDRLASYGTVLLDAGRLTDRCDRFEVELDAEIARHRRQAEMLAIVKRRAERYRKTVAAFVQCVEADVNGSADWGKLRRTMRDVGGLSFEVGLGGFDFTDDE
jgi:hypothetical protein